MIVWNLKGRDYVSRCGRFRISNREAARSPLADWVLYDNGRLVTRCWFGRGRLLTEVKRMAARRLGKGRNKVAV